MDLVVAGTETAVLMVESEAQELSEEIMLGAVLFAHDACKQVIKAIIKLAEQAAKEALDKANDGDPVLAVSRQLRHMAALSGSMLRNAVRAADEMDLALARSVLERDAELDAEFAAALRLLMSYVLQDHRFLRPTIDTIFALKGLERIGDHATNIAENICYLVDGKGPTGPRPKKDTTAALPH